jgi:hypothetical protein
VRWASEAFDELDGLERAGGRRRRKKEYSVLSPSDPCGAAQSRPASVALKIAPLRVVRVQSDTNFVHLSGSQYTQNYNLACCFIWV